MLICTFHFNKKIYFTNATVRFVFASREGKKYILEYQGINSNQLKPTQSFVKQMEESDKDRFIEVIKRPLSTEKRIIKNKEKDFTKENPDCNTNEHETDPYSDPPVYKTDSLNRYRNAVLCEMNYLHNNGGRKYQVSNGELITESKENYIYSFELEAELYLSDDAPVSLILSDD